MKQLLLGLCALISFQNLIAQPYGNEWIDDDLKYHMKFKVDDDSLYRINKSALKFALNQLSHP